MPTKPSPRVHLSRLASVSRLAGKDWDVPEDDDHDVYRYGEHSGGDQRGPFCGTALPDFLRSLLDPVQQALEPPLGPGELQREHGQAEDDRRDSRAGGDEHDDSGRKNEKAKRGEADAIKAMALPMALLPRTNALDDRRALARLFDDRRAPARLLTHVGQVIGRARPLDVALPGPVSRAEGVARGAAAGKRKVCRARSDHLRLRSGVILDLLTDQLTRLRRRRRGKELRVPPR
jgi:hypothetical protein